MRNCWIGVFACMLFACQKHSSAPLNQNKDISNFQVGAVCSVILPASVYFMDSTLQFANLSHLADTSNPAYQPVISYSWDFGDQSTSSEKSPTHRYSRPGVYSVKLFTYINNQPSDTSSASLQIIVGSHQFSMNLVTYGIGADQVGQKGVLVLYSTNNGGATSTFGLLSVDSLLDLKWSKPIPGNDNTVRLSSIKRINDDAYILSGNYSSGNTNNFCLSEIDSSGNLIWMKYINNLTGTNNYTLPVSDGGFLTTGTANISGNYFAAVVKCDVNGNEVWRSIYDSAQSLAGINNIAELDNGYVFAAQTTGFSPDIVLTELDFDGNITKQTSIVPTYPVSYGGSQGVLYNNDTYLVYPTEPQDDDYVYFFNTNFSLSAQQSFANGVVVGGVNDGSNFVVYSSGPSSTISQISSNGTLGWQYGVDPVLYMSCNSLQVGADRTCRGVVYTTDNEMIILADGPNINNARALDLYKITPDGMVK